VNADGEEIFDYPFSRLLCYRSEGFCAVLGGANLAGATFVGWSYYGDENARLLDTSGLGMGTRGSNLPGAIATIDHGGCYSSGSGTSASGINLQLLSDGQWFMVPNEDGTVQLFTPPQQDVWVQGMWTGSQIGYLYGDC
jgi:hypothetical protein